MLPAAAVDLDLHAVQPGIVAVLREWRPPPQIGHAPAADNTCEGQGLGGNVTQPLAADFGEHRGRRVGVELGEGAVEVGQNYERLIEGQGFDGVLHVGQHEISVLAIGYNRPNTRDASHSMATALASSSVTRTRGRATTTRSAWNAVAQPA